MVMWRRGQGFPSQESVSGATVSKSGYSELAGINRSADHRLQGDAEDDDGLVVGRSTESEKQEVFVWSW